MKRILDNIKNLLVICLFTISEKIAEGSLLNRAMKFRAEMIKVLKFHKVPYYPAEKDMALYPNIYNFFPQKNYLDIRPLSCKILTQK